MLPEAAAVLFSFGRLSTMKPALASAITVAISALTSGTQVR